MADKVKGLIIYCDGSARPNPGFYGWGAHGYLYEREDYDYVGTKEFVLVSGHAHTNKGYIPSGDKKLIDATSMWGVDAEKILKQYNDDQPIELTLGSVRSSLPAPVTVLEYLDFIGSSLTQGTNNKAELTAFFSTLNQFINDGIKEVTVLTDSRYVTQGASHYVNVWANAGWTRTDGSLITNLEEWKSTYSLIQFCSKNDISLKFEWVKGHNNVYGNIQADALAVIGTMYSTNFELINQFKRSPVKGYKDTDVEKHPFINNKRMFFNTVSSHNTAGKYYTAEPGVGDFIFGKRNPDTSLAIIDLVEPDAVLEAVINKQIKNANDQNVVILAKLDVIYSKEVYPLLVHHMDKALVPDRHTKGLNFVDETPVTIEMNPTVLSLRALDSLAFLDDVMMSVNMLLETGSNNGIGDLAALEITSEIFDTKEKKVRNKLSSVLEIKPELSAVDFIIIKSEHTFDNVSYSIPITLKLGSDILSRNNLKKLESESPVIYLITWRESPLTLRFATMIKSASGSGLWSNYFSDRIFLSNFKSQ